VAQRLLAGRGCTMSVRTIERAVADIRWAQRVAALATVRVETAPGDQLQIDSARSDCGSPGSRSGSFSWSSGWELSPCCSCTFGRRLNG
jgi:hypothetical protein